MRPSQHHYVFAHHALRSIAFSEPVHIFGALASPDSRKFIESVLEDLDQRLADQAPRTFTADDIRFTGCLIKERPCAILQMPPPKGPTEAFFIAIWSRYTVEEMGSAAEVEGEDTAAAPKLDYFTLERPVEPESDQESVFCGWTADGTHFNMGSGPAPDLNEFVQFLMHRNPT